MWVGPLAACDVVVDCYDCLRRLLESEETMTPDRDINTLLAIMARLRDRDHGCAWDVEQTFSTIAPYTIEEAYEVADAIARDDMADLVDELGDLLLQVVFHAQMAKETDAFDFGDVVEAITTKMIRRHPHVFGDAATRSRTMAKGMWEAIKAQEKAERAERRKANGVSAKGDPSLLDDVPQAMPALMAAVKLQKRAATVGFDWSEAPPILAKIREEITELEDALAQGQTDAIEEEYGDVLFAMANLGRHLSIEPEEALAGASRKFRRRFAFIERMLAAEGKSLADASLDEMEAIWQQAKRAPTSADD